MRKEKREQQRSERGFFSLPVFLSVSPNSINSKQQTQNSQLQQQAEGLADTSSGAQERDLEAATGGRRRRGRSGGNEGGGGAVYRSTDGGGTWQAVGSGLSAYNVFTLASAPGQSLTFYAGSDGGLWQIETPQGSPAEPGVWVTGGPRGGRGRP